MRPAFRLMTSACVVIVTLPARADDGRLPTPPAPSRSEATSSLTVLPLTRSSAGSGIIVNEDAAPTPAIHGIVPPADGGESSPAEVNSMGGIVSYFSARSRQSSLEQFQSSSYWAPPQPFNPRAAPNYSHELARNGGTHIRYPYFKYRDKIPEIAARMRMQPFPVIVERSEHNSDPGLDLQRRAFVAEILTSLGGPDADRRTIVAPAYGRGLTAIEAERSYYQFLNQGAGGFNNGFGNYGGFGGGFGGFGGAGF